MNKEELIEFLKENLTIELNTKLDYGYEGIETYLVVNLKLGDNVISSDRISLPTNGS